MLSLLGEVQPAKWPAGVSAELQTLDATPAFRRPLTGHDVAVLIASDTAEGLLAAVWNAFALVREPTQVCYLDRPEQRLAKPPTPGSAVIVRVPGMQVGTEEGFREAMRGLGTLGRTLLDYLPPLEDCRFHLSGGFKAAIPYLVALAEAMRSEHRSKITAWVQHETTQGNPIRLPLRTLRRTVAQSELAPFGPDGRSHMSSLGDGILDGYAYERQTDGTFRLTAFGEGLKAFFGIPPAAIG
jgi:CRISPR-associated protein (Cas_APE2256).